MLDRRAFVCGAALLPALSSRVFAKQIGDATLTTISDGSLVLPGNFLFAPMPADEVDAVLAPYSIDRNRLTPECNLALYQDGTNTVLFDVGSGPDFMPTAGQLPAGLEAAGVSAEDVTHIVFTHAHPDHIWGLLDDFDDPAFPQATYMMGRAEWDYSWNPETVDTIGEARAAFAVGAKRRMEAIESAVTLFDPDDEVLPGIAAFASYGHTPGHMSFELQSGGETAIVVGDAIGNHHVAFAKPEWPSGADQDTETAIRSRVVLLERLADEQITCVGFHLPGGGIGRVERAQDGFRFVQEGN